MAAPGAQNDRSLGLILVAMVVLTVFFYHLRTDTIGVIGSAGLLRVRGPNVMRGYLGDAQATERVLRDGWLAVDRLAIQDANGMGRRTLIRVNQTLLVPTSTASRYAHYHGTLP